MDLKALKHQVNLAFENLLKMNGESNVHQYAYQRIIELEAKVGHYEEALKVIKRKIEVMSGTVDYPKRPTTEDVFEVYLILKETLE